MYEVRAYDVFKESEFCWTVLKSTFHRKKKNALYLPELYVCPPFGSVALKILTYFTEMFRLQIVFYPGSNLKQLHHVVIFRPSSPI